MVDVVVVGLGLVGSAALRSLAEAGTEVVGIGIDEPADRTTHTGPGASHWDSGRVTRHLDPRWEWAVLATRSIAGYADLEARSGIAFHRPAGAWMAELDPARTEAIVAVARRLGVVHHVDVLDGPAPRRGLLRFPEGTTVVREGAPAGHIDPRRMRDANLTVARSAGAEANPAEVVALDRVGGRWRVRDRTGHDVVADRVLVAAGPHADELVGGVGLRTRAEAVVLATLDLDEAARLADLPSVLARIRHPRYADLYLVPPTTYPDGTVRLKLGATSDPYRFLDDPAERRAWIGGDEHGAELDDLRSLLTDLVPDLRASAWDTAPCLITETPSDLPVVAEVEPGLVVAAGGNGYAAKSANALGALAAELARTGEWLDPELGAEAFAPAPAR